MARTQGSIEISKLRYTQAEIAERMGVSRVLVTYWGTGERKPTRMRMQMLKTLFGIPEEAWFQAPGRVKVTGGKVVPFQRPRPAKVDPNSSFTQIGAELRARVIGLLEMGAEAEAEGDRKMALRATKEATATYAQLGRITGEGKDLDETRVAKLPAVRRVIDAVLEVISSDPKMLARVREVLAGFVEE